MLVNFLTKKSFWLTCTIYMLTFLKFSDSVEQKKITENYFILNLINFIYVCLYSYLRLEKVKA